MEIKTETYRNIRGEMVRRHIVSLGGGVAHSLKTRELWQLILLAQVEIGKCLSDDPPEDPTHD